MAPMLPNALSLLRIALVPPVLYSLHRDGDGVSAATLTLFLLAGLTDVLDGLAARSLGQDSRLGRILDPVCDKVFVGCVGLALVLWRGLPLWLMAAQLARDAAILGAGLLLLRRRELVVPASWPGKATTWAMGLVILAFVVGLPAQIKEALTYGAAVLVLLSSLDYLKILFRILRRGRRG